MVLMKTVVMVVISITKGYTETDSSKVRGSIPTARHDRIFATDPCHGARRLQRVGLTFGKCLAARSRATRRSEIRIDINNCARTHVSLSIRPTQDCESIIYHHHHQGSDHKHGTASVLEGRMGSVPRSALRGIEIESRAIYIKDISRMARSCALAFLA